MKSTVTKSTFRTLFYLRKNEVNKSGNCSIMVRITINKEQVQFSSKLQIKPELWDTTNSKVLGRSADSMKINRLLDAMRVKIDEIYHRHLNDYGYVLPEKIKNIILGIDTDKKKLLLVHFAEHNEFYKLKVGIQTTYTTYSRYELTKLRVKEFLETEYKLSDIPVIELSPIFIEKFFLFLQSEHKCNNNTAMKFIQRFKAVFYYIKNTGADIKADPFANFKFRYEKVVRQILTQEEIVLIYHKEFEIDRLDQVRDVFVFYSYTGLSYIDVANLTSNDIQEAFDNNLWIVTKRKKTNVDINVRLLDIPKAIVEKYKGRLANNKILPVCSNQKMNAYLKEIGILCGINKPITCHVARHVFASTVTLANGVPIETVSKMLGHTNIKTTQIYAKIVDSKLSTDMENLANVYRNREITQKQAL